MTVKIDNEEVRLKRWQLVLGLVVAVITISSSLYGAVSSALSNAASERQEIIQMRREIEQLKAEQVSSSDVATKEDYELLKAIVLEMRYNLRSYMGRDYQTLSDK